MIQSIITTERLSSDPQGRQFIDFITKRAADAGIEDGLLYYDFPTYADYEGNTVAPDFLFLTRNKGIFAIAFAQDGTLFRKIESTAQDLDERISQFSSSLIGRLLKSKVLRKDRSHLKMEVVPLILWPGHNLEILGDIESQLITSYDALLKTLADKHRTPLAEEEFAEARSIIEGAKAIMRPQRRIIEDPARETKAVALAGLENEIANFDARQRQVALSTVQGPQRIRGLAGSGKTIILAMKAAHLHLSHPEAQILVTFYTKSLQATLRKLITRFYRHYKEEDPDWAKVQVAHGWGGAGRAGVYSDACKRLGIVPLSLSDAKTKSFDPFDFVCRDLLSRTDVKAHYDFILIDEGQDFPTGFYELCFSLAKHERDKKNIIWAYDELQNILNVKMRTPQELFGIDKDGQPKIDLERAAALLPKGVTNDMVLSKCYRNQREVLVMSHALGFGIYGSLVQMLQNEEHWRDVGYEVISGQMQVGQAVRVLRPSENSPLDIGNAGGPLIECRHFADASAEVAWVSEQIATFHKQGLMPHDFLVISLDDRNARTYFKALSEALSARGINTNNIIADPYREPDFTIENRVTLSTVYRAKGNEAACVFAIGVDGINGKSRSSRNKLFTAFTRSKAWLRVSGVGDRAKAFCDEIAMAKQHFPHLDFVMPNPRQIETIQRDMSERAAKAKRLREDYVKRLRQLGMAEDEAEEYLGVDEKE